jgi:predicted enzyme related to lactoylglutathione lyase
MAAKKTARKTPAAKRVVKKAVKKLAAKKLTAKPAPMKAKASKKPAAKKPAAKKPAAKKPAVKKAPVAKAAPRKRPHPPVVHWEIQATDPARQRGFFSDLFGWPIDANNPQNYGMVPGAGADSIGGGIGETMDAAARVTFYVEVPDIDATLAKVGALGGGTVMPRMDIGMVIMAQFRDLEGNVIGLIEAR